MGRKKKKNSEVKVNLANLEAIIEDLSHKFAENNPSLELNPKILQELTKEMLATSYFEDVANVADASDMEESVVPEETNQINITAEQVPEILVSSYVQIENFLTPEQTSNLFYYTLLKEHQFTPTTTTTNTEEYRRSKFFYEFPEFAELIQEKIKAIFPEVLPKLQIPEFEIAKIESQLTAHNDGDFYKLHNDNGSPETLNRQLTYVYYFHRQPKAFSGGELKIYDTKIENNYYVAADSYHLIEPINNSIIFFLSRDMHEILPIRCPTGNFADSRFTINGWLWQ